MASFFSEIPTPGYYYIFMFSTAALFLGKSLVISSKLKRVVTKLSHRYQNDHYRATIICRWKKIHSRNVTVLGRLSVL